MNNLQFNFDKIADSIEEGSLKEFLKQEENRRELRKSNGDEFNSKELNQAYSYYWRKMKEFESLELREQLEKTFELYIDLCNRFDPLSYDEVVWEYMDGLVLFYPESAKDEFPPYSSVTEVDSELNYYLSQAKILDLYERMCEKLKYLEKMVRKRGGGKRVEEAASGAGSAKNVFAEAVKETMEESVASIEDYGIPPEEDDATCDYLGGSNCKQEEKPEEGKQEINSIPISQDKARKLYNALRDERVGWLLAPMDENEFVNVLMHKPTGKKIKFINVNQVRYVTKKYLFPDKKMKHSEWELIEQLFEAENGKIERVKSANKPPENSEILDEMMDE